MSSLPVLIALTSPAALSADLIVCPVTQGGPFDAIDALLPGSAAVLQAASARGEFLGKPCELFFGTLGPSPGRRFVAVGLGPADRVTADRWRRAAAAGATAARARRFAALALTTAGAGIADLEAAADGIMTACFDPSPYRTAEPDAAVLGRVEFLCAPGLAGVEAAIARGRVFGDAVNTTRALANEPGNRLSPHELGQRALAVARAAGLGCDVLQEGQLDALGMRLLLGVGRGSAQPPRLIVLRYEPARVASDATLAFVGKGVTFDTGGISIKPSEKMELMKYDMAGGAAVIGAMQAVAALRPAVRVVGIVPAAENMPGGRAIRPGDVLASASGKTVEVNNTDAEGRLILADALWYARQHAGATHLIDLATLTGACVVALGRVHSGFFGNDEAWNARVARAAARAGDRLWPMPLDEEYAEQIRSDIADLVNIGGRAAGAVTAAKFLQAFVGDTPWVHLDIAGTAWLDEAQPWMAKGPTGVATRTLVELALAHDPDASR